MRVMGTVDDVSLSGSPGGVTLRVLVERSALTWRVVENVRSFRVADNGTLLITRMNLSTVAFAFGAWSEVWQGSDARDQQQ